MKKTKPIKPRKEHTKGKNKGKDKGKGKGKKQYKIRNWKSYNQALVNRGKVTLWLDEDAQDTWQDVQKTHKPGAPKQYSDGAITTCLTFKSLFHLPLRATEGFVTSIFESMNLNLSVPDFSTLSIRAGKLSIDINTKIDLKNIDQAIDIVIDSSGAKVYGEGEWKVKKHGAGKHRTWRKFHLAIDPKTKKIKAAKMTGNDVGDGEMLEPLLAKVENPIHRTFGDGAYDKRICYDVLHQRGIVAIIPPQKNAKIWRHGNRKGLRHARDENLRRIREIGKPAWKEETQYHTRSIAENGMFRYKTVFGERLWARRYDNQQTEVLLKCKILNQFTDLGMPKTARIPNVIGIPQSVEQFETVIAA